MNAITSLFFIFFYIIGQLEIHHHEHLFPVGIIIWFIYCGVWRVSIFVILILYYCYLN